MAVSMKNVDIVFQGIGQKTGTEVWRIEKFCPVLVPKSEYGKFYSGDSYIILRTSALKIGAYHYDVHFWLGKNTSQDEAGAAAIKSVELDAALGGRAVQYRECQGQETDKFLSYFKPCIIPLDGGAASGFRKVEAEKYESRLFTCKGSRLAHVTQVPFARHSLNHEDVFILDTKNKIYQFNGASSSIQERGKALEVVQHLKDTNHDGKCEVVIIEDGNLGAEADAGEFWGLFGGFAPLAKKTINDSGAVQKDVSPKLLSLVDGHFKELTVSALKKEILDSSKCYLLDSGSSIFVWWGRNTTLEQRKAAAISAEEVISYKNACHVRGTYMIEGFETLSFKSKFEKWPLSSHVSVSEDGRGKVAALLKQQGVNVKGLLKATPVKEEYSVPPLVDATGKLEVWRVDGTTKAAVPSAEYGKFLDAHCYVVLYTYQKDRKDEYLLFNWLGKNRSKEDKSQSLHITEQMASSLKGRPVQARILEGCEPPQFLALFQYVTILKGCSSPEINEDETHLIRVQGVKSHNIQAVEVEPVASSLNSSNSFLLLAGKMYCIWHGSITSAEEQKTAMKVAEFFKGDKSPKPVKEGSEPPLFWTAVGGKQSYPSHHEPKSMVKDPRLFVLTHVKGNAEFMEVFNFTQDDLMTEDILILDASKEVFVWVGQHASASDKKQALNYAQDYLDNAVVQYGVSPNCPVYRIPEGNEPSFFTSYFSWDSGKAMVHADTYTKKLAVLLGRQICAPETSKTSEDSGGTQRAAAMAALSSVFKPPSLETPVKTAKRSVTSPKAVTPLINSPSSQRAAAMAALSSVLSQHSSEQAASAAEGDWAALPTPLMRELRETSGTLNKSLSMARSQDPNEKEGSLRILSYETVKTSSTTPAVDIDKTRRESYLSDDEFQKILGLEKAEFYELPKWKRDQKKRLVGLF